MDTNSGTHEAGLKQGLWRRWPVTTFAGLGGGVALAVLVATGAPAGEREAFAAEERTDAAAEPDAAEEDDAAPLGTDHEGGMGAAKIAASRSKSGLYAMKGPKDAIPEMAGDFDPEMAARNAGILGVMGAESGHFLASPYGGAMAVGSDDADVWGGLVGTEVGEAYGVGGLGLVGTGRGGGGTGEGTIGLGSRGVIGKGGGVRPRGSAGGGRYDPSLQSGVLTVGTVDDNADPSGYEKALERLAGARAGLGIADEMWKLTPRASRHDPRPGGLDVALVIDTTGSMGDELEYLKVELRGIALEISREFPGVDQRWGLVVYRDRGDDYVTRTMDFQGIEPFIAALGAQEAGGGGDTPEAMDAGLMASGQLAWRRDDATARVVFLVADAPTHSGAGARRFIGAVQQHRDAGTAIYPVGASGVDDQAEAQLRLAARATGGQYIFLTDHSGVGGHHAPPKVEQFKVETLNVAMTRMIRAELGSATGGPRSASVTPPAAQVETPVAVVDAAVVAVVAAPEAECPGMWEELRQRLAAHLLFASSLAALMFMALGVDACLARRRRGLARTPRG